MDSIVNDLDIQTNYSNTNAHVPEAERNIRVIEERIGSLLHHLPHSRITELMLKRAVKHLTMTINFVVLKDEIDDYYSPFQITHETAVDYDKHCKFSFESYIQVNAEADIKNESKGRTLDCIYLNPVMNSLQGGHELSNLHTGEPINRGTGLQKVLVT